MKKDSTTMIPSNSSKENQMHKAPQNIKYVNSHQGGPSDARATKAASMEHGNAEYFKKQKARAGTTY
jgi:hypothetical protein